MTANTIQTNLHKITRQPAIGKILEHCYARPEVISLAGGIPDDQLFPVALFGEALSELAKNPALRGSLQYNNRYGYAPLREWVVAHLNSMGIKCTLENILITTGSQQVIDLAGKHCVLPGDDVHAAEATYFAALQSLDGRYPQYKTSLHADIESGVERGGDYKASLAYFVPDFDNPTGRTLDLAARQRTIALAEAHNFSILEDAAYALLRFEGKNLPSLLQLDIERVLFTRAHSPRALFPVRVSAGLVRRKQRSMRWRICSTPPACTSLPLHKWPCIAWRQKYLIRTSAKFAMPTHCAATRCWPPWKNICQTV